MICAPVMSMVARIMLKWLALVSMLLLAMTAIAPVSAAQAYAPEQAVIAVEAGPCALESFRHRGT